MTDTTHEPNINEQIEALLKLGIPTIEVYKKTCEILFYQYGTVPTTTKLYSLIKKGSMSTPAKAINEFWASHREKARLQITVPGLPEIVKTQFENALSETWKMASERGMVAAQEQQRAHLTELQQFETTIEMLRQDNQKLHDNVAESEQEARAKDSTIKELELRIGHGQLELSIESQRLKDATNQIEELKRQLDQSRQDFLSESLRLSKEYEKAQDRLKDHENRALMEIERERQSTIKANKEADLAKHQNVEITRNYEKRLANELEKLEAVVTELKITKVRLEMCSNDLSESKEIQNNLTKANAQLEARVEHLNNLLIESSANKNPQKRKSHKTQKV
jgi:chromosome segregation ATPase